MPRNSRKSAPLGYLSATQAMELIGVQRSTFYNMIKSGSIEKKTPPGHKEGYYLEHEIRKFAREYHAFMSRSVRFELALPDDIEPIRAMVARESGGYNHTVPSDVMLAWQRKNNRSIWVLRRDNSIVGYVSLFPISPYETIIKRMTGEYWNRSIPLEDIQPFLPDEHIQLYIAELTVDQSLPDRFRLATRLLLETRSLLVKMAEEDQIVTDEIYAVATTPFGINACRKLQMEPMNDLPSGVREDRIPFKMDVKTNKSHLFGRYREKVTR